MSQIEFTKEELKAVVIQVGARIDELKALQKEAGKNEDIRRVIELEEFLKPIESGYQKMVHELYKI